MVIPNNSPIPYSFKFSEVPFVQKPGGTVKIVDSRTFKASKNIAAAEVTVEPGAMRLVIFISLYSDSPVDRNFTFRRELHVSSYTAYNVAFLTFFLFVYLSGILSNQNGLYSCKLPRITFLNRLKKKKFYAFREGKARITLFAAEGNAQTFDFYVSISYDSSG
jgi:hypothetical protein